MATWQPGKTPNWPGQNVDAQQPSTTYRDHVSRSSPVSLTTIKINPITTLSKSANLRRQRRDPCHSSKTAATVQNYRSFIAVWRTRNYSKWLSSFHSTHLLVIFEWNGEKLWQIMSYPRNTYSGYWLMTLQNANDDGSRLRYCRLKLSVHSTSVGTFHKGHKAWRNFSKDANRAS